jgi:hypothetical protein
MKKIIPHKDHCTQHPSYRTPLNEKIVRVSRKQPCPICNHADFCGVSADGVLAFCMRVSQGSIKTAGNGAYIHKLRFDDAAPTPTPQQSVQPKPDAPLASIEHRDGIYSMLIRKHLELLPEHKDALHQRGLPASEIERCGFRSTPTEAEATSIARTLSEYDLTGVPGFYKQAGEWRMVTYQGMFIPVRDQHSRIQALMVRRDNVNGSGKYFWLSSTDKPHGASSGAPSNYANAHLLTDAREVTIAEGILKASVAAYFLRAPVIGNAPSCFGADFAANLKRDFPKLQTVFVAFDMDFKRKPEVEAAMFRLVAQLEKARFDVRVRTWPDKWKGIDDFLLGVSQMEVAA